jgi:SNF2 family DNA or RNA helicase
MKVKIEYLPESREAKISTDEIGKIWTSIIRAGQDKAQSNLNYLNEKEFVLPWWSFLLSRESIGYHLAKNKVQVDFSEDIKRLLQQAIVRKELYRDATDPKIIEDEDLEKVLKKNGFRRALTREQFNNVKKIASLPSSATFSVPGAGKTTEALAYFCYRKTPNTRLLVVCPKNAFAAWEEQVEEIFGKSQFSLQRLTGGEENIRLILQSPADISLITYTQLSFAESPIAEFLLKNEVFLFLDESHRMKRGDTGKIGSTVLGLAHLPLSKFIMSGTPMPNGISDLVPQFRFLYPEIEVDEENVRELIKPIYVRTTKRQLKIPPVTRIQTFISLSPAQRVLYQLLCSELAREHHGSITAFDRRKLRSLGKSALRLIQLVSNPSILANKITFEHKELLTSVLEEGDSPKLEYVTTRARQLAAQGKKTIIWSSFVQNVELVAARLYDLGADYIHGGVEAGSEEEEFTRERKIKRFHDDNRAFVLVANPAACSEGISLHTVCHHAIYLDRNYNAAQYLQSEDRIHRLGLLSNQQTIVEILCCPDTIDESVANRLSKKIKLMGEVLDDPDLNVDPIPFDPDNDAEFDFEDAEDFIRHIKLEAGGK